VEVAPFPFLDASLHSLPVQAAVGKLDWFAMISVCLSVKHGTKLPG